MTNTTATAQELLDQILETGRDWTEIGRAKSGDLTKKAKELAAQGEDILVDKLGVEDTEVGREALRKGIGAGAAAGALALVLSSRSGRKMATLGGLAGLVVLAYKAYEKNGGEMPNWKEEVVGLIKGPKAEIRAETLLRAMVAAARADDVISTDEMALIQAHDGASVEVLESVMSQEPNAGEIAALADNEQTAREIYAVSCRVANGVETAERAYLDELAMKLRIDPELAARIETDIRTG
jgi:uncharacterized membrane protein YebE (DUF533 family)